MARLVIGRTDVAVDDHGVFHAGARTILQRELRELIRKPESGIKLEGMSRRRQRAGEKRCATGQEELMHRHVSLARYRGTRRLPDELPRGCPCKVVHAIGDHVPDEPIACGRRAAGADFVGSDDGGDGVAGQHGGESSARCSRQHLSRILQQSRAAHEPPGRHIELHVEPAEVVVELRGAEVLLGIPSPQVVIDSDAWKPLCRLKERVGPALCHSVPGARATGDGMIPLDLDRGRRTRRDGGGKEHAGQRGAQVDRDRCGQWLVARRRSGIERHRRTVDAHRSHHHAVGELRRHPRQSAGVGADEVIRVETQRDLRQWIGTVVVQRDRLEAAQSLCRHIEPRANGIVGAQLPVLRAGTSRGVTSAGGVRGADRVGHRNVATDGTFGPCARVGLRAGVRSGKARGDDERDGGGARECESSHAERSGM